MFIDPKNDEKGPIDKACTLNVFLVIWNHFIFPLNVAEVRV